MVTFIFMKLLQSLLLLGFTLFLSACSPHPVSGVWATTDDNEYGISRIIVSFNGRAEFVTTKLNNATWHCFWGATDKNQANLDCTPSTDPDQPEIFHVAVNEQGLLELRHQSKLVSTMKLKNENPKLSTD